MNPRKVKRPPSPIFISREETMDCKLYNKWRRDIVAEYILSTGRTFPRAVENERLHRLLVRLSDVPSPPSPEVVIRVLRRKGFVV